MRTWITTILRHACLDSLRMLRRRPEGYLYWESAEEEEYPDYGWLGSEQPTVEADMIWCQKIAPVHHAINRLSVKQRQAVYHYLEHGDITHHNSTLKVHKTRALKRLRALLASPLAAVQ